jgi:glutamyl-tRNA synthetase
MTERPVRVRIAPSPTGHCHVGTARTALYNLLFARQHGGTFILRIDDTDARRSTAASETGVLEGLAWLGLAWDEGPDRGGPSGPYRQSERLAGYQAAAARLLEAGRAYHCFCTQEEAADRAEGPAPGPRIDPCAAIPRNVAEARVRAGERAAVRFRVNPAEIRYVDLLRGPITQDMRLLGDRIVMKADGLPTYSFATVVDDDGMRISHVLRSAEHISNTFLQLALYEALGMTPPEFAHFSLLLNPDGSKISKRSGAVYVGDFRDQGMLPEAVLNHVALAGWNPGTEQEIFSLAELQQAFSIERCATANAVFDHAKLHWMNGVYIRALDRNDLARRVVPFLERAGLLAPGDGERQFEHLAEIVGLVQEGLKTLLEAPDALEFFYRTPEPAHAVELLQTNKFAKKHTLAEIGRAFDDILPGLTALAPARWVSAEIEAVLNAELERLGWKKGELLMAVRIATAGREATPSVFHTLESLGRETTLARMHGTRALLP